MDTVRINLGPRSYDIALSRGTAGIASFTRTALPRSATALVVCDSNTQGHGRDIASALTSTELSTATITIPAGESSKCTEQLTRVYDALYDLAADRQTAVVAVGGGVIGDLAGFAAATYNRGLPLVMVPTSLLAMVDSSVGGKTAINHLRGKNLIGAFHQPRGVWIDLEYLTTLPEREYISGLAEVVKYGAILDEPFFAYLEAGAGAVRARVPEVLQRIVARCCRLKADVVEKDEQETTGLRAVLNYGHTFAHAFEALAGYGALLHGEAVAIGMMYAAKLAARLNLVTAEFIDRQAKLLRALSLPTAPDTSYPTDELLDVMRRDKKALGGKMQFILPTRIGEVQLYRDVPEALVRAVLEGR
jgi:3-dehydroquinate synthase